MGMVDHDVAMVTGNVVSLRESRAFADTLGPGCSPQGDMTLGRLFDEVGNSIMAAPPATDLSMTIRSVVIYEPGSECELRADSLVLLVGADEPETLVRAITRLGTFGVRLVAIRGRRHREPEVAALADSDVVLLSVSQGVSWIELTAMLRRALRGPEPSPQVRRTRLVGDLFSCANAISALLDAPVTIEDPNSRVVAYSGRQDEGDDSRIAAVLQRQVPERYLRMIEEAGVFEQIYRSREPVWIPAAALGTRLDRVAVAVLACDEYLGTIWAAVDGELTQARKRAFADSAELVAAHMIELRVAADTTKRQQCDLVAELVDGGQAAESAMERSGLGPGPAMVIAVGGRARLGFEGPGDTVRLVRVVDAFAVYLAAVYGRSVAATINGVGYAVVALGGASAFADVDAARIVADFLERTGGTEDTVVGIGRVVSRAVDLGLSRSDCEYTLDLLRTRGVEGRVATFRAVHVDALLLKVSRESMADGICDQGPVSALARYDHEHSTVYLPTLDAWLGAFGDVGEASAALHIHPNTFRYRLGKLRRMGLFDLDDPRTRFRLMVHLRLRELR